MKNKVFIKTFGCQMNQYDSEKILLLLNNSYGFTKTIVPEEANLIIINTCSIREKAQEKLFSELGMWKKIKDKNPNLIIGVCGCVASQEGKAIIKRAPYVDILFGPQTIHKVTSLYYEAVNKNKRAVDVSFPSIEKFDHFPVEKTNRISSLVSIMEGCSKYCSFCIVPYTRGEELSRPFDDILKETYNVSENGAKEVILLGQNVNDYSYINQDKQEIDLAILISYIATIDNIKRIRFTTSHPLAFNENLIEAYNNINKLCNHLHLPVQSGSDKILEKMKRGYKVETFINKINLLRKVRPSIKISSDFIVGFPGETEEDFQETLDLVDQIKFDTSYSFIYSPRPGTPAANILDNVSIEEKKDRLKRLQDKISLYSKQYSRRMLNQRHNVLVTGRSKKDDKELTGRTECNRIVNFKGDIDLVGNIASVYINDVKTNSLKGQDPQIQ